MHVSLGIYTPFGPVYMYICRNNAKGYTVEEPNMRLSIYILYMCIYNVNIYIYIPHLQYMQSICNISKASAIYIQHMQNIFTAYAIYI